MVAGKSHHGLPGGETRERDEAFRLDRVTRFVDENVGEETPGEGPLLEEGRGAAGRDEDVLGAGLWGGNGVEARIRVVPASRR